MVDRTEMVRQCCLTLHCSKLHHFSNGKTKYTSYFKRKIFPSYRELCFHRGFCSRDVCQGTKMQNMLRIYAIHRTEFNPIIRSTGGRRRNLLRPRSVFYIRMEYNGWVFSNYINYRRLDVCDQRIQPENI